ncbi:MAG: hypothetical protein U9M95_04345 [Candidatus Altiarchaeota archaeon]|nr:hypothetical protein [Candidatus Altiarchaeota archaeon]
MGLKVVNKTILMILIIVGFLINIYFVSAQPSMSSVSGNVVHGNSIVINGSEFGVKEQAEPALWDTVENQYVTLNDGETIPVGGNCPWEINKANSTKYEVSDAQRGMSTAYYKGVRATVGGKTVEGAKKLYLSWWEKSDRDVLFDSDGVPVPYSEPGSGHSSKFLRLNGAEYHFNPGHQTISWTQIQNYVYDNGGCLNQWFNFGLTPINEWHFIEYFADQNNQVYWINIDGTIVAYSTSNGCESWDWDYVWYIGFDAGGNRPPSPIIGIDDIYVDNTQARVMVGDNSTYSLCTHREIQIPISWSDDSITINVNQGSFSNGEHVYLFVVDGNGTVSEGYPVTFSVERHRADLNDDGVINMPELMIFIARWKAGDGITRSEVLEARDIWFSGGVY